MNWTLATNFLIAMLAIVNPVGKVPMWLKSAGDKPDGVRFWIAVMITATGGGALMLFLLLGNQILSVFGIDLASFKIGGGVIILLIAIRMVQGTVVSIDPEDDSEDVSRLQAAKSRFRQVVVPMAIPMIAGPGSISTAIIYSSKADGWIALGVLAGVLVVVMAAVFGVLLVGHKVREWVGNVGLEIVTRLFGLILAGIAAQLIVEGLGEAFPTWLDIGSPLQDDVNNGGSAGTSSSPGSTP